MNDAPPPPLAPPPLPKPPEEDEGRLIEIGNYAVRIPLPQTRRGWVVFGVNRLKSKFIGMLFASLLLGLYAFVNHMDFLLGFDATPRFLKNLARGEADRVKTKKKGVVYFGERLRGLPSGRALLLLEVTSEVNLGSKLDVACALRKSRAESVEGYLRREFDPDSIPGGIRAGQSVTLEIDFPSEYEVYADCEVIEAR